MKKNQTQLINNMIGQLEGIKRMMEKKEDCYKVLIQLKAVKSASENLLLRFAQENMLQCAARLQKKEQTQLALLLKEIVKQ